MRNLHFFSITAAGEAAQKYHPLARSLAHVYRRTHGACVYVSQLRRVWSLYLLLLLLLPFDVSDAEREGERASESIRDYKAAGFSFARSAALINHSAEARVRTRVCVSLCLYRYHRRDCPPLHFIRLNL